MEIHKITLNRIQGFRGMEVKSYDIDPPLPEDEFSYLLHSWNYDKYKEGEVELVSSAPRIVEGTALIKVSLGTTVFVREGNKQLVPVKQISISARVKALQYGGRPFIYGGFMDINCPTELPLEVLEWKIGLEYGNIVFESRKGETSIITAPPSLHDVHREEKRVYPREPFAPVDFERFFFERWLKDNTLTQEMLRNPYEKEILVPYEEDRERYENEVAQQVNYYNNWLRKKEVIFTEIQEMWEYLQVVILPDAGLQVEKEAKVKLQEVGHLELLDSREVS